MSRVRIVCKAPPAPAPDPSSPVRLNGIVPSMVDCEVFAVGDDGIETALSNVQSIAFRVACGGEPAAATIEFFDVELDVEAIVEGPKPTGCPACSGLGRFDEAHGGTDSPDAPACATCNGSCWVVIRAASPPRVIRPPSRG